MRHIIWSDEFSKCVEELGGARAVDRALDPLMDALMRNPYGFDAVQNDWTSFRYARTKAIGNLVPALIVVFTIDDTKDVILQWVAVDAPF
jgi:hypothetical protein